jgi:DNA-binding transcriptional MerR regulator
MAYSIKEIASLACVSTRTIRYYDEIGLLLPSFTGKDGYRYYDHRSLLILQQILFFRRLEMPLKEIASILEMPTFNSVEMLQNHRQSLQKELQHTRKLITTIDNTISMIKGDKEMTEQDLFIGFDEGKYVQEVEDRWGDTDAYKQSIQRWSSYSEYQKEKIKNEGEEIITRMVGVHANCKPGDEVIQKAVGDYLAYLNKHFYNCNAEFLRGLSLMWVEDPRFAVNYERIREGGAQFVHEAVEIFCQNQA